MKKLRSNNKEFYSKLELHLNKRSKNVVSNIDNKVKKIINDVIKKGDKALFDYAKKFDNSIINKKNILLSSRFKNSYKKDINSKNINAFKIAIKNITNFHRKQIPNNYKVNKKGVKTSLIWKPINSVGLYVPGGNAIYPSSLLMNVIPAKVAGVKRIVVATPAKFNEINPYILALLDELDIKEVYQIGGAHSIAALAYGTESIKPVDKIFGPGNAYIASAKKQVFGKVGIDLIAGPSEIVVVADKKNNPQWVAADLIAQAEHDVKAQSILITDSEDFSKKVIFNIKNLSSNLPQRKIIEKSFLNHGLIIIVENLMTVHEIINFIAPEHLHLQNKLGKKILKNVTNAGGIFLGDYTCEAFGDYIVGTNHILPTSGSAKFASGLGVFDFMKRSSVVEMNFSGYKINQENVSKMAEVEKLLGHKLSVKIRQIQKK